MILRITYHSMNKLDKLNKSHIRHVVVKNFRKTLVQYHLVHVESRPIEKESIDVYSVLGRLVEFCLLQRHKIVHQKVNGDVVLSRVVLPRPCQECLREVEP